MTTGEIIAQACGWAATIVSIYAYSSKTMIPLRVAIIGANLLSIVFSAWYGNMPNLVLNVILLPLNILRLIEMRKLIVNVSSAVKGDLDAAWLKPFMREVRFAEGEVLWKKGDEANRAILILTGAVNLPEIDMQLGVGTLFGEMGLFTRDRKRTASAICEGPVTGLAITYDAFEQLYFQNPQFGLYLVRLMVQRWERNLEQVAARAGGAPL